MVERASRVCRRWARRSRRPQGPAGPPGKVELVTCKTVKKRARACSSARRSLVSGTVKFTAAGASAQATLSRHGAVYAAGTARVRARPHELAADAAAQASAGPLHAHADRRSWQARDDPKRRRSRCADTGSMAGARTDCVPQPPVGLGGRPSDLHIQTDIRLSGRDTNKEEVRCKPSVAFQCRSVRAVV